MRCIIVDDEAMAREHLGHLCQKIESVEIVGTFEDAMSAYRFLEKERVDLAFLDIEMPDLTGIELVQSLQDPPAIVFITSKENYAVETFDFIETVVDYLLKPVTLPRLLQATQRYLQRSVPATPITPETTSDESSRQHEVTTVDHLFVKADRKYVRIDLNELLYVETVGDYSIFKTIAGQHTVHTTLKSVLERLSAPNFLKVHRSFIVNLDKIKDIEDSNLLIGDKVIPISRNHRAELMERIMPL